MHSGAPIVHDVVTCVDAPGMAVAAADGQIRHGCHGVFAGDRRLLSRLELRIDGDAPAHLDAQLQGGAEATFTGMARADVQGAAVTVERHRRVRSAADHTDHTDHTDDTDGHAPGEPGAGLRDRIALHNADQERQHVTVEVFAGSDFADIAEVRAGRPPQEHPAGEATSGLCWTSEAHGSAVTLAADPPPDRTDLASQSLRWDATIEPGQTWEVTLALATGIAADSVIVRGPSPAPWSVPEVHCADGRVADLLTRGLADLEGLLAADPADPRDAFLAAGAPWYLTLFGRDSLWAARMLLPLGTEVAGGTLRALARRQGTRFDEETEEAPGKIPHELRHEGSTYGLPPAYFGTVDATPLFVCLLADAWRWGLPRDQVESLVPAAERALTWLRDHADPDGDGFLEYVPTGSQTLANQGWKDSADGVRFGDGRIAEAPIALAEVQAYAYEAAMEGADLLDAFSRPGGDDWRDWAGRLRTRFREAFWVEDSAGAYPAIALDAAKQPVDSVTSNIGHLLGTGLLDTAEEETVARRLAAPEMDSGWGLRTLSRDTPGFNPLGYHTGSVWPHDTAIAVGGLARGAHAAAAAALLRGLIDAAPRFSYRLPELYGGQQRTAGHGPVPYPSTCQPQAWSAAAVIVVLQALLGLEVDVPRGRVRVRPLTPLPCGPIEVRGLRAAGRRLSVRIREDGAVHVDEMPEGLTMTG